MRNGDNMDGLIPPGARREAQRPSGKWRPQQCLNLKKETIGASGSMLAVGPIALLVVAGIIWSHGGQRLTLLCPASDWCVDAGCCL